MQTRTRCYACKREWVFTTTPGVCICGSTDVGDVNFEPLVRGLDIDTRPEDLPCPLEDVPHLDPAPVPENLPMLRLEPFNFLTSLGERL